MDEWKTCPTCGRQRNYEGECGYCWGIEAGQDVLAGRQPRQINSNPEPSSGCVVLVVLALCGLIPLVLLAHQVLA